MTDQLPINTATPTGPAVPTEQATRDLRALLRMWFGGRDLPAQVTLLNEIRGVVSEFSPFREEPVDYVEWVPMDDVQANSYNPNSVAPPEMELLRLSILADGFTQPIVSNAEDGHREVVDGFHRSRVGKEFPDVGERVKGYLPLVQIRSDRGDRPDRMASTIRHNRARGKHQVIKMSEIVMELKRRNWSDSKVAKELGMDPDEVLRLTQITGLAEAFANQEFSEAWEAELGAQDDDLDDAALDAVGIDGGLTETERAGA